MLDCWICGSVANSGEHIIKRTDLAALFNDVTQADPIFLQREAVKNHTVGSLKSSRLTHSAKICNNCNNHLTQPHDQAWERLSHAMRSHTPELQPSSRFRAQTAFPSHTHRNLLHVHLYFVKAFGCMIRSGGVNIPLEPFAKAILETRAHPEVYIRFGVGITEVVAGVSDLWVDKTDEGEAVYATWIYQVGSLWVNLIFAKDGQHRQGMAGAWHPRTSTAKLIMANFKDLPPDEAFSQ